MNSPAPVLRCRMHSMNLSSFELHKGKTPMRKPPQRKRRSISQSVPYSRQTTTSGGAIRGIHTPSSGELHCLSSAGPERRVACEGAAQAVSALGDAKSRRRRRL